MRVLSLIPSATEHLCLIGGREMLVGRSHECDFPPGVERVPVVTSQRAPSGATAQQIDQAVRDQLDSGSSLYSLDEALALALKPDVILTQDLCSVCSIDAGTVRRMAERMSPRPRVVSLNPGTVEGIFDDVMMVGEAVGLEAAADAAVARLRERMFRAVEFVTPYLDGPRVAFLEWTDPLFCGGHWTPQLIERAGARDVLNPTVAGEGSGAAAGPQQAYRRTGVSRRVKAEELVAGRPERIVICPCGVPLSDFARDDAPMTVESLTDDLSRQEWWADLPAVNSGHVALVDGNQMFSRPGPRVVDAMEWLVGWLNDRPAVIPPSFPWRPWDSPAGGAQRQRP